MYSINYLIGKIVRHSICLTCVGPGPACDTNTGDELFFLLNNQFENSKKNQKKLKTTQTNSK